jgi:poly(A) polymerase
MSEIWALQTRFGFIKGRRPLRTLSHPRFRAAYDFLLLRVAAGEADPAQAEWWTQYQHSGEAPAVAAAGEPAPRGTRRRRPRRRGRRKARPEP